MTTNIDQYHKSVSALCGDYDDSFYQFIESYEKKCTLSDTDKVDLKLFLALDDTIKENKEKSLKIKIKMINSIFEYIMQHSSKDNHLMCDIIQDL